MPLKRTVKSIAKLFFNSSFISFSYLIGFVLGSSLIMTAGFNLHDIAAAATIIASIVATITLLFIAIQHRQSQKHIYANNATSLKNDLELLMDTFSSYEDDILLLRGTEYFEKISKSDASRSIKKSLEKAAILVSMSKKAGFNGFAKDIYLYLDSMNSIISSARANIFLREKFGSEAAWYTTKKMTESWKILRIKEESGMSSLPAIYILLEGLHSEIQKCYE